MSNYTEEELEWANFEKYEGPKYDCGANEACRKARAIVHEYFDESKIFNPWFHKWHHDRPPFTVRWTIHCLEWKHRVIRRLKKLVKRKKKC